MLTMICNIFSAPTGACQTVGLWTGHLCASVHPGWELHWPPHYDGCIWPWSSSFSQQSGRHWPDIPIQPRKLRRHWR